MNIKLNFGDVGVEKKKDNGLIIIVKIEKYIEYMLQIMLKLPRTEKFSIGTEIKTSMYDMLKKKFF
jgi:hypothetical protein